MIRSHINILLLVFAYLQFCRSQTVPHKFIAFKSEEQYSSNFDLAKREKELNKKYDSLFENKAWLKEYVEEISTYEQHLSEYGVVYKNWSEASDYLNQVIKEILGKEWKENVVVQIRRDEENNAFMIEDGKVYINVGLLATVTSEAQLAAIIGHEYGHYKSLHFYKGFVKEQQTKAKVRMARLVGYPGAYWVARSSVSGFYSHSRENESEADKIAIDLIKSSRYNLNAVAGVFEKFYIDEKKRAREKGYRDFVYYHTHPPTQERILNSKKECSKADSAGRKEFIIDEAMFQKIRRQAIDECIYLGLKNFDYKSVMEACYTQLLYDPRDEFYMFYLCESIRRSLAIKQNEADNYFITGGYYIYDKYIPPGKQAKVSLSKKVPKINGQEFNKTINYQCDFLLFGNDSKLIEKLPVNELTNNDTIEFVTTREAFNYFIDKQIKLGYSSVNFILSMLKPDSVVGTIVSQNSDLNDYNEIMLGLKKKAKDQKVVIIPLSIDHNKENLVFWKSSVTTQNLYTNVLTNLRSICRFPYYTLEYETLNLHDKRMIFDFLNGLKQFDINKGNAPHFLDNYKNEGRSLFSATKLNAISLFPEIVPFLMKNSVSKILYMDISLNEMDSRATVGPMGGIPMGTVKTVCVSDYYVDLENPSYTIKHHMTKGGKTIFFPENIATQIYSGVKMMEQESIKNIK